MKRNIYIIIFILLTITAFSQNRIQHNGQDLFLNGINLAWMSFANDLTAFDEDLFAYTLDEISVNGHNGPGPQSPQSCKRKNGGAFHFD